MIVEEVLPFLEENIKILAAEKAAKVGVKTFYGRNEGTIAKTGELNPDMVVSALCEILKINYITMPPEHEKALGASILTKVISSTTSRL